MRLLLTTLAVSLLAASASAGTVMDRIRASGVVHCGATARPGLAFPATDGSWHGLQVDICHAVAIALLGPAGRSEMHAYSLNLRSYDSVRDASDDLAFLSASEMLAAGVLHTVTPGPPVYYDTVSLMVPDADPAQHAPDLQTRRICAEPGTGPERTLLAWYASRHIPIHFFMFQESDEMLDAFYGGRCEAIAHYTTSLAAIGLQAGHDGHPARMLPERLAAMPIFAMTPRTDPAWSATVDWTVQTLLRAETLGTPGPGGGPEPLPLAGPALGLPPGWQTAVLKAVGSYADIYRRALGDGSPLALPRELNALWPDGVFCPPFTE